MGIIGLDIHRAFAEAVAWEDGKLKRLGRVDMRRELLAAFAARSSKADVVVVEATGNAAAVTAVIAPHVKRVVIANPKQVRVIAHAKRPTQSTPGCWLSSMPAASCRKCGSPTKPLSRCADRSPSAIRSCASVHGSRTSSSRSCTRT